MKTMNRVLPLLFVCVQLISCRGDFFDQLLTPQVDPRPNVGANTLDFLINDNPASRMEIDLSLGAKLCCLIATFNSSGDSLEIRSMLGGAFTVPELGASYNTCNISNFYFTVPIEKLVPGATFDVGEDDVRFSYFYRPRSEETGQLEDYVFGIAEIDGFKIEVIRYDEERNVFSGSFVFNGSVVVLNNQVHMSATDGIFDIRINSRQLISDYKSWGRDFFWDWRMDPYYERIRNNVVEPEHYAEESDQWVWQDGAWYNIGALPL